MANPLFAPQEFKRPPKELCEGLAKVGSATCTGDLYRMGIRSSHIIGPVSRTPGKSIAGPALTLMFLPKREDIYGADEYANPEIQLHRHCLYQTQPGDIVVVDSRQDMSCGVFGEMMLTYFMGRGGAGVVIDGCIRDYPEAAKLGIGLFLRGTTPNFHTQTNLFPVAYSVPISCGGCLVMPGDIIVADDDGVVVVPQAMAPGLLERASVHHEWEGFSRERLAQGGDLQKYYPLRADAEAEYQEWKKKHGK